MAGLVQGGIRILLITVPSAMRAAQIGSPSGVV
jgi:hypothetical protein